MTFPARFSKSGAAGWDRRPGAAPSFELAILDRQMEMQKLGHTQRLEEIAVAA
jgi:hypothetical protein